MAGQVQRLQINTIKIAILTMDWSNNLLLILVVILMPQEGAA
jgi:hypothetical protein